MAEQQVSSLKLLFDEFFESYYSDEIKDIIIKFPNKRSLMVDIGDLEEFDPDTATNLIADPEIIIDAANESLRGKLSGLNFDTYIPHVRFYNQSINTPMVLNIGSAYINKFVSIDALVVKRSDIRPKIRDAVFVCTFCNAKVQANLEKEEIPKVCPECKKRTLKIVPEESTFFNSQKIAVQDPLERLSGSIPTWQLEAWLDDDLVNMAIPGDRVEISGILKIRPRKDSRGKVDPSVYSMYLNVTSLETKQKEFADIDISEDEERQIKELSKDPDIFNKVTQSVAPSIYGYNEIKQAVALQLFGGTPGKKLVDGGPIRSDMHILLIGDPGSAKTRILQSVARLVPKGIYVSGKSVTGGGLTAVAERDDFSEGGWTLKAGAMVLGNGGIVAIDEFDKISEEDTASLHEALESQTISVAKAGIIATFNAKASVLAAANPKFGRFDPHKYPAEQFDISPTLLSRFDLIFPIRDIMDTELDKSIANYILNQHEAAGAAIADVESNVMAEEPPIGHMLLKKYIAYAKRYVMPRLSEEASKRIKDYYVDLRRAGSMKGATPITPRQIEGLIRMAEASAKSQLRDVVSVEDANLAINLSEYMLKTLAVDTEGRTDIDTILTGMPREKVDKINVILDAIKKLEEAEGSAKIDRIFEEVAKDGIDKNTANKYINELEQSGDIFSPKMGIIKVIRHEEE